MAKWNFVAMGQAGLTGWTRTAAQPVARLIARRTGRPEAHILALIGAGFLAITLIDFLRNVPTDAKTFAADAKSAFAPQTTALQNSLSGLGRDHVRKSQPPTAPRSRHLTMKSSASALRSAVSASGKC